LISIDASKPIILTIDIAHVFASLLVLIVDLFLGLVAAIELVQQLMHVNGLSQSVIA